MAGLFLFGFRVDQLLPGPSAAALLSFIEDPPPVLAHRTLAAADVGVWGEHGDAQAATRSQQVLAKAVGEQRSDWCKPSKMSWKVIGQIEVRKIA